MDRSDAILLKTHRLGLAGYLPQAGILATLRSRHSAGILISLPLASSWLLEATLSRISFESKPSFAEVKEGRKNVLEVR
jgi:hypothetical protein